LPLCLSLQLQRVVFQAIIAPGKLNLARCESTQPGARPRAVNRAPVLGNGPIKVLLSRFAGMTATVSPGGPALRDAASETGQKAYDEKEGTNNDRNS
jgi:hypothetical protein